jgi:hypothetical protein
MKCEVALIAGGSQRVAQLEPKPLAGYPLAQTFVEILRLLSFHIFFRLMAGGLKPA